MSLEKKRKLSLGTYSILIIILVAVSVITMLASGQPYIDSEGAEGVVEGATISQILLAPIQGFHDAGEVIGFIFCLGAFLSIVTYTGALESGINVLVKKMKGKELMLIPILMFLFSIGGSTYGMGEETVGFYILLAATMTAAGMDPLVGAAIVLLGAGSGVLGSTINPFATGAAVASAGVELNMGIVYAEGLILWLVAYVMSTVYVFNYAKKVMDKKGSILTAAQLSECISAYGKSTEIDENPTLTGKQKICMWIFALTFVVMILGFIPWGDLNEGIYNFFSWSKYLTGSSFGDWWFDDAATWFLIMGLIIGFIGMEDKSQMANAVMAGISDMVSVNVVIVLARATSVIMSQTGFGNWLVQVSVTALTSAGIAAGVFGVLDYLLHIGLSFLVPSSSGLAALSSPIVSPIVSTIGWSAETSIMINVAANGLVNLFTPTCGFIMGGLALARIPYEVWIKWSWKLIVAIAVASAIILTGAMLIF
ncbi:MAG: YfcC family protein [Eubacteriales bacterium]